MFPYYERTRPSQGWHTIPGIILPIHFFRWCLSQCLFSSKQRPLILPRLLTFQSLTFFWCCIYAAFFWYHSTFLGGTWILSLFADCSGNSCVQLQEINVQNKIKLLHFRLFSYFASKSYETHQEILAKIFSRAINICSFGSVLASSALQISPRNNEQSLKNPLQLFYLVQDPFCAGTAKIHMMEKVHPAQTQAARHTLGTDSRVIKQQFTRQNNHWQNLRWGKDTKICETTASHKKQWKSSKNVDELIKFVTFSLWRSLATEGGIPKNLVFARQMKGNLYTVTGRNHIP